MDRNRANRMTKLRLVARETHDDAREIRSAVQEHRDKQ